MSIKRSIISIILVSLAIVVLVGCGSKQTMDGKNVDMTASVTKSAGVVESPNAPNSHQSTEAMKNSQSADALKLNKSAETTLPEEPSKAAGSAAGSNLVDNWSEPKLVENWAESVLVDNWSEPKPVENWAESALVDNWSEPKLVDNWAGSVLVENGSEPKPVDNWSEPKLVENWSESLLKEDDEETLEEQAKKIAEIDVKQFYGTYSLWIPGGMTNYYYKDTGNFATGVYNPGAGSGTVKINKDGTYRLDHLVWGDGEVKGKWRLPEPGEIDHDVAIILVDGPRESDWAVVASDGKLNLFMKSVTNDVVYWYFNTNMNEK